jgi:hypothetical protein
VARDWTWRIEDRDKSRELRLRYEPGGYGDLLKAVWMAEIVEALAVPSLRIADPFAGAPDYPATERALATLELGSDRVRRLQAPFVEKGRVASTMGMLVKGGSPITGLVFDLDEERRDAWRAISGAEVLAVEDGWDALADLHADLVLVDPYDLHRRSDAVPRLAALVASGAHVVCYLYNRASQGVPHLRAYEQLRRELATISEPALVGRLPTDAVLPRAWHELLLFRSRGGRAPIGDGILATISAETRRIAAAIAGAGAVEP